MPLFQNFNGEQFYPGPKGLDKEIMSADFELKRFEIGSLDLKIKSHIIIVRNFINGIKKDGLTYYGKLLYEMNIII